MLDCTHLLAQCLSIYTAKTWLVTETTQQKLKYEMSQGTWGHRLKSVSIAVCCYSQVEGFSFFFILAFLMTAPKCENRLRNFFFTTIPQSAWVAEWNKFGAGSRSTSPSVSRKSKGIHTERSFERRFIVNRERANGIRVVLSEGVRPERKQSLTITDRHCFRTGLLLDSIIVMARRPF